MGLSLKGSRTSFQILTGIYDVLPVVPSYLYGGKTSISTSQPITWDMFPLT